MRKVIQYKTAQAKSAIGLDEKVNQLIAEGWQPYEQTIITPSHPHSFSKGMAKYEDALQQAIKASKGPSK